jgi:hypothetical protein
MLWNNESIMSLVVLILYTILFLECATGYYAVSGTEHALRDRFYHMKRLLFSCIGISVILSAPRFIWCFVKNVDGEIAMCHGQTKDFALVECMHLISMIGFSACLGMPVYMWSCMLRGDDVDVFSFRYKSLSKVLFHGNIIYDTSLILIEVLLIASFGHRKFEKKFHEVDTVVTLMFAIGQTVIMTLWVSVGAKLQYMLFTVTEGSAWSIMLNINIVLFFVLAANITKAFLFFCEVVNYNTALNKHMVPYTVVAFIMPYFVCNYLIVKLMKWSNKNQEKVEGTTLHQRTHRTSSEGLSPRSELEDDEIQKMLIDHTDVS